MHLADSMGGVPGLLEILGQNLEARVEAVWLESLHPLELSSPGPNPGSNRPPSRKKVK